MSTCTRNGETELKNLVRRQSPSVETHVAPVCSRLVRETLLDRSGSFEQTDSSRLLSRRGFPFPRYIFDRVERSISNSWAGTWLRRPEVKRDRSARERSCQG